MPRKPHFFCVNLKNSCILLGVEVVLGNDHFDGFVKTSKLFKDFHCWCILGKFGSYFVHKFTPFTTLCVWLYSISRLLPFTSYPSFSVLRLVVLLKLHHYSLQEWLLREAVVQTCFVIKVLLEISQNSQENTCARDSFLIKLQALFSCEFCEISKNTFFYRTLWFCIEVSCFSFSGWIASSAMYSVWEPFIKLSISSSSALSWLSNHA